MASPGQVPIRAFERLALTNGQHTSRTEHALRDCLRLLSQADDSLDKSLRHQTESDGRLFNFGGKLEDAFLSQCESEHALRDVIRDASEALSVLRKELEQDDFPIEEYYYIRQRLSKYCKWIDDDSFLKGALAAQEEAVTCLAMYLGLKDDPFFQSRGAEGDAFEVLFVLRACSRNQEASHTALLTLKQNLAGFRMAVEFDLWCRKANLARVVEPQANGLNMEKLRKLAAGIPGILSTVDR